MTAAGIKTVLLQLLLTVYFTPTQCILREFSICHDDFSFKPPDGVLKEHSFPWLAFVQYINAITGLQHAGKAPRVVLIHRQFALGTTIHMINIPRNYKLGNIVFGEYERDERECGLTDYDVVNGVRCPKSYLEVPIENITPHPEFLRFGVANSLALVKLLRRMKSGYAVPVCLPTLVERYKLKKNNVVSLIDYTSVIPKEFDYEIMAKKTLKLYTHAVCKDNRHSAIKNVSRALCTSGCGVRPGAPIINQDHDGRYELVGLSVSSGPCSTETMRDHFNSQPPVYIDIYPYNSWIINVITAHRIPETFPALRISDSEEVQTSTVLIPTRPTTTDSPEPDRCAWKGRTFLCGRLCFAGLKAQKQSSMFYAERFEVTSLSSASSIMIEINVSAGIECTVTCVRVLLPNRFSKPVIGGIGSFNISMKIDGDYLPRPIFILMALSGTNSTKQNIDKWLPVRAAGK